MKQKKVFTYCLNALLLVFLGFSLSARLVAQESKASGPPSRPQEIKAPEHPITEEQIRTFFNVCHILSWNRRLTHEKMELQRKQLPEWYPQPVWDEIEDAIDNIDLPQVALPVYQKYISEDDAEWLIKFFATPQGQKLTQSVFTKDEQAQRTGAAPLSARAQALADLARNEGEEVQRILSSMSAKELRDIQSRSAHFEEMKPLVAQMQEEIGQVTVAKQMELAKAIVARHQVEMAEAQRKYEASHAPDPAAKTPQ